MKTAQRGLLSLLLLTMIAATVQMQAQSLPTIEWKNGSGQGAVATLNSGANFVTDFRGTNDVTITELSGSVNSVYQDNFGGASSGNNPDYLKTFVGNSATNTGDGGAGHVRLLETALTAGAAANSLQFDFLVPLDANSRILIADVDLSEVYTIQAYHYNGTNYVALSLTGWSIQNYTGQTGAAPNINWPTWNSTTGTLTGNSPSPLNEPSVVLTPDQSVDRLVFTKQFQATSGSAGIQIFQVPEPSSSALVLLTCMGVALRRRR